MKPEEDATGLGKRKRRRRLKTDSTEISQYEEVVHSSSNQNTGSVIYEETVPMSESEQVCSEKSLDIFGSPDVPDVEVPGAKQGLTNV